MLNARLVVFALLLFVPLISGKGLPSEQSLIGTWELRGDDGVIVDITYRADHSLMIESRSLRRRLGAGTWRVDGSYLVTHVKTHIFPELRGKHLRQPIIEVGHEILKIQDKNTVVAYKRVY
jgi:hypothetical protein